MSEIHQELSLAQKWAVKEQRASEYACNVFADKIARINVELDRLDKILKYVKDIELEIRKDALLEVKQELIELGTALWISKADVVTNLGLRVGISGIVVRRGKKDAENSITNEK